MPLLEVGPFTVRYGERFLYERVEIILEENDFLVIKGPSGCGKSTLLRQIVGLEKAQGARRILAGQPFPLEKLFLFRKDCLLLPQGAPLIEGSIYENLTFFFSFKVSKNKSFSKEKLRYWLDFFSLPHLDLYSSAQELSIGERHRLALVRAFLWDPLVILADEPFSGLDKKNWQKAFQSLWDFSKRPSRGVICIVHEDLGAFKGRLMEFQGHRLIEK